MSTVPVYLIFNLNFLPSSKKFSWGLPDSRIQCCLSTDFFKPLTSKDFSFFSRTFWGGWKNNWEFFHTKIPQNSPQSPFFAPKGEARRPFFVWWQTFYPKSCLIWSFCFVFCPSWPPEDLKSLLMCANCLEVSLLVPFPPIGFFCVPWTPKKIYQLFIFGGGTWNVELLVWASGSKTVVSLAQWWNFQKQIQFW